MSKSEYILGYGGKRKRIEFVDLTYGYVEARKK